MSAAACVWADRRERKDVLKMKKWRMALIVVVLICCAVFACGVCALAVSAPKLTVTSDIVGLGDTGNKSTLKVDLVYSENREGVATIYHYDENGERIPYEGQTGDVVPVTPVTYTGAAVFDLGTDAEDELIDSSGAVVRIVDGSGYHGDEFILHADSLDGEWSGGQYVYTLEPGDIEWNTWDYDTTTDYNSGREWSIMGGDGNGVYRLTAEVSGIVYDGQKVPAATFPIAVYVYGRSSLDLGISTQYVENTVDESYTSGMEASSAVQWDWHTENESAVEFGKPYMQDTYTDYFSVIWPKGTDAAAITAEDVTVTLRSEYGEEYVLSTETAYGEHEYTVIAHPDETVIAVTYQQWAFVPVFSTMEIMIADGELTTSKTYDICSVTAYMVQTGGGGEVIDHTVTCYNYYGVTGLTPENAANSAYTLSAVIDGVTYYYAEDEDGNGYLSPAVESENFWGGTSYVAPEDAWQGDATEKYNIAVRGNVVFAETRLDMTEDKTVGGETITFTQNVSVTRFEAAVIAAGAELEPGYSIGGGAKKWGWTMRYQSGWIEQSSQPTGLPYAEGSLWYGYAPGGSNPAYDGAEAGASGEAS